MNVEGAEKLANAILSLRDAVKPCAAPGTDAAGGTVDSLTEAIMGITAGLEHIALSICDLADAVRERESVKP
jgi:hypothetical protein